MTNSSHRAPDVAVIGGGIIGCSIALRLAQAGMSVTVLDRSEAGAEASSAAAGMLAPQGETVEPDPFFNFCFESRKLYPQFVAEIESLSGLSAGYRRDGTLLVATDEEESRELDRAYNAQSRIGLAIERLNRDEAGKHLPGLAPEVSGGLFIPGDHAVDNERLMQALIEAARKRGIRFVSGTAVTGFNVKQGRIESLTVSSSSSNISAFPAGHFVLAAGCWSGQVAASLGLRLRMEPCHGQIIEFESSRPLPMVVRRGHFYLVPRDRNRIVAGTTAEYAGFEKAVTADGLRSIIEGVQRFVSWVKEMRFRRAWAGLRPDTADHLPILGRAEWPNLTFATGHFRNGILLAPITAKVISELVLAGKSSQPIEAYRPSRFAG
jgi:glycine oxidase